MKKKFDQYLYAIYFCEKLGGTGLTGFVYDNKTQKPLGGFIIIDSGVIRQKANDWITFKEKSVYSSKDISLTIQIEKESENTIDNALRYILLHEMGHILSNTLGITPDLRGESLDYDKYPFFNKTWVSQDESVFDEKTFPLRSKVIFYASESAVLKLDTVWHQIYPMLAKTNFPTLYGATNGLDHFAETLNFNPQPEEMLGTRHIIIISIRQSSEIILNTSKEAIYINSKKKFESYLKIAFRKNSFSCSIS